MTTGIELYREVQAMEPEKIDVIKAMDDAAHVLSHIGYTELASNLDVAMDVVGQLIHASRQLVKAIEPEWNFSVEGRLAGVVERIA